MLGALLDENEDRLVETKTAELLAAAERAGIPVVELGDEPTNQAERRLVELREELGSYVPQADARRTRSPFADDVDRRRLALRVERDLRRRPRSRLRDAFVAEWAPTRSKRRRARSRPPYRSRSRGARVSPSADGGPRPRSRSFTIRRTRPV